MGKDRKKVGSTYDVYTYACMHVCAYFRERESVRVRAHPMTAGL